MIDNQNIELRYFKTIGHEDQWFLLYEFTVNDKELFNKSDQDILREILSSRMLGQQLFHEEMEGAIIELKGLNKSSRRPYVLNKLDIEDFQHLKSKSAFDQWITTFKTDDWEDDREVAQILIGKAEIELNSRTELSNGVWLISKGSFAEDSEKLIETHWIYLHFETFIEINRTDSIIRTFDFGYD